MDSFSLLSSKIEDNRSEKIAFVIDLSAEILNEEFLNSNGEKMDRLKVLFEEISNFIKLKDYFNSRPTQFAFYSYNRKLNKEIDFCELKEFDIKFTQIKNSIKNKICIQTESLDLSLIFSEATQILGKKEKEKEANSSLSTNFNNIISNESLVRFILFYNRDMPVVNSKDKEFNNMAFIRLTNFYFDVVYLRKKMNSDEDKKSLTEIYNSLTLVKTKYWYATEISGNYTKIKFFMNLLLANPNQRVKIAEVDKFQKKVEEIVSNYIES